MVLRLYPLPPELFQSSIIRCAVLLLILRDLELSAFREQISAPTWHRLLTRALTSLPLKVVGLPADLL